MDINCTNKCIYQDDGKCNLTISQSITNVKHIHADCPYYLSNDDLNDHTHSTTDEK